MNADAAPRSGSIVLEGLIDGPLPPFPDGKERLLEWESFAREQGVPLRVRLEGPNFNALADDEAFPAPRVHDFAEVTRQVVEQLWKMLPSQERRRLFSTLRSTQYRETTKVETVYAITPDGTRTESRTCDWKAAAGPSILRRIGPVKLIVLVGMLILGTIFIVSRFDDLAWIFGAVPAVDVVVEADELSPYVTVTRLEPPGRHTIDIELRREKELPTDLRGLVAEQRGLESRNDLDAWTALDALVVDARVNIDSLDGDGKLLASDTYSVRKLREQSTLVLSVPYHRGTKVLRVRP